MVTAVPAQGPGLEWDASAGRDRDVRIWPGRSRADGPVISGYVADESGLQCVRGRACVIAALIAAVIAAIGLYIYIYI